MPALLLSVVAALLGLRACTSSAAILGASAAGRLHGRDTAGALPTVDLGYTVQQATSFNVRQHFNLSVLTMSSNATA